MVTGRYSIPRDYGYLTSGDGYMPKSSLPLLNSSSNTRYSFGTRPEIGSVLRYADADAEDTSFAGFM